MSSIKVSTTINGDSVDFLCETDEVLLDVLRDRLHLTGAKEGCGTGDCGACSVTMNGRLVCSCLVLGAEAGAVVVGVGHDGRRRRCSAASGPQCRSTNSNTLVAKAAGANTCPRWP